MYFNLGFYRSKSNDNLSFTKAVENANNAYSGENYQPILPTPPLLPNSSLKHIVRGQSVGFQLLSFLPKQSRSN